MLWTIKLGYKNIQMSATFNGMPFSMSSTYPKDIIYMEGISSRMNRELAEKKILMFLKNLNISSEEAKIFEGEKEIESGILYVPCDENYESSFEVITKGIPKGSLVLVDERYERGFAPDSDIVILTCEKEKSELGSGWVYNEKITTSITKASFVQGACRVGRTKYGKAIILSKNLLEIKGRKTGMSSLMIESALSGDTDKLVKKGRYSDLKDINFIRGAISLKDYFGEKPPVILIGLNGTTAHPKFGRKPAPTRQDPKNKLKLLPIDENLWWEHENPNETKPTTIDEGRAKELLKLIINTYIKKEKNFPKKINKVIPSQLY
jgi:hypothetical protein